jgi:metal-responsive CopG/Arc/MetJ family transcriptional regulator
MKAVKFAVSIPEEDYRDIEKIRKKEKMSRSGIVVEAIRFLKKFREKEKLIRQYEEGYRNMPEKLAEIKGLEAASMEVFSKEGWK